MTKIAKHDYRQMAVFIATELGKFACPSMQVRNDVGPVQIDYVSITEGRRDIPAIQFKFDLIENMGVTINVKISEFQHSPVEYMKDLYMNLNGIRHDAKIRRNLVQRSVFSAYQPANKG